MNDRTMIAAMAMQGILARPGMPPSTMTAAKNAIGYADALLKELAETELRPHFTTSDDQRIVVEATGLGEVEFLTPYPSPHWWEAQCDPNDPGPVARAFQRKQMLDTLDKLTETAHADEVGDWRRYVRDDGKRALMYVAAGGMGYVGDAFSWGLTPQGYDFWETIYKNEASALTITRAQDFARRVLAQMEADGE